jgi:flagellar basal body-associated protein FliL
MSEPEEKKSEEKRDKKGLPAVLSILLPALIAGGAAFGGAKLSAARAAGPAAPERVAVVAPPPPGPTVSLEPFVLVTPDLTKKMHPMRVTLAVEFEEKAKEETLKSFTPRIRDAALSYFRGLTYEEAVDGSKSDKVRTDLLDRFRAAGAVAANRVLITDLVIQ